MMSSVLVGCGKNSDVSSNITSKEIAKKLIEADYLISPKEVDSDMVEEVYHLNLDDVENYAIYETERRPGPGFIMIVKAKDGKVENVKNSMEKVLEDKVGQAFYPEEQEKPDGNFPTVDYPNTKEKKAFKLALELAKKVDADVVLANDPDADRLGIYAKDTKTGEYMTYTGNMSALLIAEYRISQMKEKGLLPADGMFITTIVSSELAKAIAKNYGLECIEVLTGFKNIGAVIKKAEEKKDKHD